VKRCFDRLHATAAALPLRNIDTDMIFAGRYLKTISRDGLGDRLFADLRYDAAGNERPDFVLNDDIWRHAGILIALDNFGTGSSREHAPWALLDFGIRCVIAPSFADIFYNNCFKNFILPIVLAPDRVAALMMDAADARRCRILVDLLSQTITRHDGGVIAFDIEPERKHALLHGIDDIAASLGKASAISDWEARSERIAPPIPADIGAM
jgi:3-isopropylmalate/(R)-2-methylmalate dehydratase small subunit